MTTTSDKRKRDEGVEHHDQVPLDLNMLREVAVIATPGPWTFESTPDGLAPMVVGNGMAVAETFDKPNLSDAKHIAAWNPRTALDLLNMLDAVRSGLSREITRIGKMSESSNPGSGLIYANLIELRRGIAVERDSR